MQAPREGAKHEPERRALSDSPNSTPNVERCYLMDPDTDVCQTEQPQISYSVDFTAEQSSAMGSPLLLLLCILSLRSTDLKKDLRLTDAVYRVQ